MSGERVILVIYPIGILREEIEAKYSQTIQDKAARDEDDGECGDLAPKLIVILMVDAKAQNDQIHCNQE